MTKKSFITFMLALFMGLNCSAKADKTYSEVKQSFNSGWQFHLEGTPNNGWEDVTLPHDWSIHLPFDEKAPAGNEGGYLPTGKGEYRKTFYVDGKTLAQKGENQDRYQLYFEGVYMNSQVYVNNQLMGGHPYGYSSFFVDITNALKAGDNTVLVKVDNSQQKNCRWYSGSGIYRNVWLIHKPCLSIDPWGIQITTPSENEVHVKTTVYNHSESAQETTLITRLSDGQEKREMIRLDGKSERTYEQIFKVENPKLWSPESPYRYKAIAELSNADKGVTDREERWFGIRTIQYDAVNGFQLNGKTIKLNGGCLHHDNGILGAAAFKDAEIRKVQLMKVAGYNAARTSHNPPSEAFLDACDSIGLLVIDELLDGWRTSKTAHDYASLFEEWYKEDVKALICRDRNHPSVICWSVGNEIIERKEREAVATGFQLREQILRWDVSRPITAALAAWDRDWEIYDPLAASQDIVGYNYMIQKAESDHQRLPERVMWQTESYPRDAFRNWQTTQNHSYVVGDFVWTSIDYLGESGIGRYWYEGDVAGESWERPLWPWHAAYCGDIDLTGYLKPIGHYRSILWNPNQKEQMYLAVYEPDGWKGQIKTGQWSTWPTQESWTWPGWEGKDIDVVVYTRQPEVKLYLNGKLIDTKSVNEGTQFKAEFRMPYQPGELKAVAGSHEQIIRTASKPHHIVLNADRTKIDPEGLCFVDVWIADKDGNICTTANNELTFTVKGDGELAGAGNADITDTDSYADSSHKAWHGHALAVIRANGNPKKITMTVKAKGLKAESIAF